MDKITEFSKTASNTLISNPEKWLSGAMQMYPKSLPKEWSKIFSLPHQPILVNIVVQWGQWGHMAERVSRVLQRDQRWMGGIYLTGPLKYSLCRKLQVFTLHDLAWGRNRKLAFHYNLLCPRHRIVQTMGGVRLCVNKRFKFVYHL